MLIYDRGQIVLIPQLCPGISRLVLIYDGSVVTRPVSSQSNSAQPGELFHFKFPESYLEQQVPDKAREYNGQDSVTATTMMKTTVNNANNVTSLKLQSREQWFGV